MDVSTQELVEELSLRLNRPGVEKLHAALLKQGVSVSKDLLRAYVGKQGSRQIFARLPPSQGKVVADRINHRWAVDLIDLTATPDPPWRFVLVAQDLFSRRLMARKLRTKTPGDTAAAFAAMVSSHGKPSWVTLDMGGEFKGAFAQYLRDEGIDETERWKGDYAATATLDRAIRTLREALSRVTADRGNDSWGEALDGVVRGINETSMSTPLMNNEPNEVSSDKPLIFQLMQQSVEDKQRNTDQMMKRQTVLESVGGLRAPVQVGNRKFRRGFQQRFSESVKTPASFFAGTVTDQQGETYLTKQVLPVSADSGDVRAPGVATGGSVIRNDREQELAARFREPMRRFVEEQESREVPLETVAAHMRELGMAPGARAPDLLRRMGLTVVARGRRGRMVSLS